MRLKQLLWAAPAAIVAAAVFGATAYGAQPVDGNIGFQPAVTPVMEKLTDFHNHYLMPIIVGITLFVTVLMGYIMWRFSEKRNPVPSKTSHNTLIEIVWTVVPVIILLVMVVPSMRLLYFQDVIPEADMTIKATGNTWNWEYAYVGAEYEGVESFVSNMLEKPDAIAAGKPYLLGTDAPLVVPVDTTVRVLVTSSNNLHSFAMPAFGIKMDALPGRINQTWFRVNEGKTGTYYGQCSELCGIKHSMMPIEIKVVEKDEFKRWVANGGMFENQTASLNVTSGAVSTAAPK